jgi:hypothetical protein
MIKTCGNAEGDTMLRRGLARWGRSALAILLKMH